MQIKFDEDVLMVMNFLIEKFGNEHQLLKCVEELAELQKAILKLMDNETEENLINCMEEYIDVMITTIQMRVIVSAKMELLGLNADDVNDDLYTQKVDKISKIAVESFFENNEVNNED